MPYYRERLLSAWSSDTVYDVGSPPAPIDPAIRFETTVRNSRRQQDIGDWAPNPKNVRRNQVEKSRVPESNGTAIVAPKFLSEKSRASEDEKAVESQIKDLEASLLNAALHGSTKSDVPVIYRNVEIKYSRFGVDDFDFRLAHASDLTISRLISILAITTRHNTRVSRRTSPIHTTTHFYNC